MRLLILFLFLAQAPPGGNPEQEFMGQCMAERPGLECIRESLITFGKSKPVEDGTVVTGKSERLLVRVSGDRWLRNGWRGGDSGAKDLGLLTESLSFLDFELREASIFSPPNSDLLNELSSMLADLFAKLQGYGVIPEYLGDATMIEKALPSGAFLKLASRCYAYAKTTNCAYVGAVEWKDVARTVTAHSTGTAHLEVGEMIESIQLR